MGDVEGAYVDALSEKRAAYRRGMRNWPTAPEILVGPYSFYSVERDVAGAGILSGKDCRSLWTLEDAERHVTALRKALGRVRKDPSKRFSVAYYRGSDTAEGWGPTLAKCEARLEAAKAYYAETERLRDLSGYEAASTAEGSAREALVAHVAAIMAEPPTTMAGVVIHAQALAAFGRVEQFFRVCTPLSWDWAARFAANVLRIAGEAPAPHA